jgi:hypothetical protein
LVSLLHAAFLNPRLDLLVRSELQHLSNLSRRADCRAADLDAGCDECECVDVGKIATVGSTKLLLA